MGATTTSVSRRSPPSGSWPACARSMRQIVRRRLPMVSSAGETRSKGSVSQAGITSTLAGS